MKGENENFEGYGLCLERLPMYLARSIQDLRCSNTKKNLKTNNTASTDKGDSISAFFFMQLHQPWGTNLTWIFPMLMRIPCCVETQGFFKCYDHWPGDMGKNFKLRFPRNIVLPRPYGERQRPHFKPTLSRLQTLFSWKELKRNGRTHSSQWPVCWASVHHR